MTDGFMGPPWQLDWTEGARTYRDSLPLEIREQVHDVAITLVTAKNPLQPEDLQHEPARSTRPKGPHIVYFDSGRGWLRYTFVARMTDPQIVVEEMFWQ